MLNKGATKETPHLPSLSLLLQHAGETSLMPAGIGALEGVGCTARFSDVGLAEEGQGVRAGHSLGRIIYMINACICAM